MKIAQVAPLIESVPPKLYGGTERVVSYLTEELVRQGHDVTLFASGDSTTRARLVPVVGRSMRLAPDRPEWLMWHTVMIDQVFEMADRFDVIHFHTDFLHDPMARRCVEVLRTTAVRRCASTSEPVRRASARRSRRCDAVEAVEARERRLDRLDVDAVDEPRRLAVAQPPAQRVEAFGRPLQHRLDRTVHAVADPAGDTAAAGFVHAGLAKADALHLAVHADQPAFDHRHCGPRVTVSRAAPRPVR